jgi:hypothetical protein
MEGPKAAGKNGKLERRCMSDYSHTLHDEGHGFDVWASCYENQFQVLYLLQPDKMQFVH